MGPTGITGMLMITTVTNGHNSDLAEQASFECCLRLHCATMYGELCVPARNAVL